jgi:hypothetical protein
MTLLEWSVLDLGTRLSPFEKLPWLLARELHHEDGSYGPLELGVIPLSTISETFGGFCTRGWIRVVDDAIAASILGEQAYVYGYPVMSREELVGCAILTREGLDQWLRVRVPAIGCGPPLRETEAGLDVFRRPKGFSLDWMSPEIRRDASASKSHRAVGAIEEIGPWAIGGQVIFPLGWRLVVDKRDDRLADWTTSLEIATRWYQDDSDPDSQE